MIVYWLLLLPVAVLAYFLGSMDSMTIASRFVFRYNLRRLGTGNIWLSNFRRQYGIPGALGLLLVEVLRDSIPILFGALMLSIKGHADVGCAFAGFCLVLGRLYPLLYNFRGNNVLPCMVVAACFIDISMGLAALAAFVFLLIFTRSLAASTIFSAVIMLSAAVLIIDDSLIQKLAIFMALLVLFQHIPAFIRILNRTDPKISLKDDLSYKFDL